MGVNRLSQGRLGLTLDGSTATLAVEDEHMNRLSFITVRKIPLLQTGARQDTEACC